MKQTSFPMVPFGSVLKKAERFERREDDKEYRFAGVYSFSKGLFFREPIAGNTFKLPQIQRLREGDFVYSKIMAWEGAFALAPAEAHDAVLSGAFLVYEIDRTQVLPAYLKFYFQNRYVWKSIGAKSSGTNVRRQSLAPELFEKELFPLPSLSEQQIIVERLEEETAIQEQVRKKQQKSATLLTHLRQAVLREAVQGRLVPQDATDEPIADFLEKIKAEKGTLVKAKKTKWQFPLHSKAHASPPYDIPKSWVWARLWDVAWCFRGHNPPKEFFSSESKENYVRFVQITDFKTDDKAVYVPVAKNLKYVQQGEIIMAAYRHIGKLSRNMEGAFNVALCKVNNIEPLDRDFLELLIKSDLITKELLAAAERGHIPSMHTDHLLSLWVVVPPLPEQRRIVAKVTELLAHCTALEAELLRARQAAEALHAAALREAFQGAPVAVPA